MRLQGAHVVRVLLLAVVATAIVPPTAAWWLNGQRVQRTLDRATLVASQLGPGLPVEALCGPGRVDGPTDAWGNCFMVTDHWVLSMGPNGALETPSDARVLLGDDVGVRRP